MAQTKMALNKKTTTGKTIKNFIRNSRYFADGVELIAWRVLAIYHVLRTMIHR